MNERTLEPSRDFAAFQALLSGVISEIAEIGRVAEQKVAAE
jgi:hypothetical protein